jgi:hypothetical protein
MMDVAPAGGFLPGPAAFLPEWTGLNPIPLVRAPWNWPVAGWPGHLPYDTAAVMANQPFHSLITLLETVGLSIVFLGLAFWCFTHEEF